MKFTLLPALIGATALCLAGRASAADIPDCRDTAALGSVCLMKAEDLHPTQFSVGNVAVECKRKKIEKEHKENKKDELEKYGGQERSEDQPGRIARAVDHLHCVHTANTLRLAYYYRHQKKH